MLFSNYRANDCICQDPNILDLFYLVHVLWDLGKVIE